MSNVEYQNRLLCQYPKHQLFKIGIAAKGPRVNFQREVQKMLNLKNPHYPLEPNLHHKWETWELSLQTNGEIWFHSPVMLHMK